LTIVNASEGHTPGSAFESSAGASAGAGVVSRFVASEASSWVDGALDAALPFGLAGDGFGVSSDLRGEVGDAGATLERIIASDGHEKAAVSYVGDTEKKGDTETAIMGVVRARRWQSKHELFVNNLP
jgi:hypothetical protein